MVTNKEASPMVFLGRCDVPIKLLSKHVYFIDRSLL